MPHSGILHDLPGVGLRLLLVVLAGGSAATFAAEHAVDRPVFTVDVSNPTSDKPQSKLWFAHDAWWAWMPNRQGSSVWRRTASGWQRAQMLDAALRQVPGRADVWLEDNMVRAVLVARRQLTVATLRFDETSGCYALSGEPARFELESERADEVIETATIAHDSRGVWWIAYPWRKQMWIRATQTAEGKEVWSEPHAVSDLTDRDDLCALVRLPGAVGLAWSNQTNETMNFRLHKDGARITDWEQTEVIDRGDRTADDHISAKATADGTLLLATKNSVDRVGEPQLVLRIRQPSGVWQNLPYACRTKSGEPSRPLVLLGGTPENLLLLHTWYRRTAGTARKEDRNTIECHSLALKDISIALLDAPSHTLIDPGTAINNVTGCKQVLPEQADWIVLASDARGNVYEGRLDSALQRPTSTGLQAK